jgi:hypothetical protein
LQPPQIAAGANALIGLYLSLYDKKYQFTIKFYRVSINFEAAMSGRRVFTFEGCCSTGAPNGAKAGMLK